MLGTFFIIWTIRKQHMPLCGFTRVWHWHQKSLLASSLSTYQQPLPTLIKNCTFICVILKTYLDSGRRYCLPGSVRGSEICYQQLLLDKRLFTVRPCTSVQFLCSLRLLPGCCRLLFTPGKVTALSSHNNNLVVFTFLFSYFGQSQISCFSLLPFFMLS